MVKVFWPGRISTRVKKSPEASIASTGSPLMVTTAMVRSEDAWPLITTEVFAAMVRPSFGEETVTVGWAAEARGA